jgi:hypothetical protein
MKCYLNKVEKDGKVSYSIGVKYTNKAGEKKTGFIPANLSTKIEAPAKTEFVQINSFMLGVGANGTPKIIVNNYEVADDNTKEATSPIARMWVNKNQFGKWQTSAKNEYNGNTTYANMSVTLKEEPEGDSAFIAVKDAFFSGYENKDGKYVPTLIVMDYDRVQKDAAEAPVAEETVAETVAEEDECPFDMD